MNKMSKLQVLHQKTQSKRALMKTTICDATTENTFFHTVKDSIYKTITEEELDGAKKR